MNDEGQSEQKPSFEEIVAGKDVALGKEIAENLRSEDIGVSIIKRVYSEMKTKVGIDREVGEEDFSVRKRDEYPSTLLGIAIPTENEGEYIYIGIQEQGFVINTEREDTRAILNPEINSVMLISSDKFIENLTEYNYLYKVDIKLKEDENPEEFNKVFAASVEKQREKVKRAKMRRAEARSKLKQGLFGKSD